MTRYDPHLLKWLALCGSLLVTTSCALVEKQMDRMTKGPTVPADIAVRMDTASSEPSQIHAAPTMPTGPLRITLTDAMLLCLENNRSLEVQRLTPSIRQTAEDQERAAFDPVLDAEISGGRTKGERLARSGSETEAFITDTADGMISLEQYFPTGTMVALEAGTQMTDASLYEDRFYSTRLGMTVSQALLNGYGTDVNLARLQQARLETRMSEFELRGYTESLVAALERTYWEYALARRQIEIVDESLKVARQQLNETQELITVGRLARAELAAVQAEVAAQEQALIEARASRESIHLQLLRLINPAGPGIWQREVELIHQPTLPDIQLEDVDVHVDVSLRMRPILNQTRLEILRGDLELVKTRNGLLPVMDLFITLGKSGYANSFGQSMGNLNEDSYDALAGVRLNYPAFNRDAEALHRRARLTREQTQKALENLSQLVEVDVRTAYIEVNRTKQQITASSVTRMFDEQKLLTETEKLRVGKSTSFLVAQAQRDLLVSRIAEVRVLVDYLKALIDLYRQDGSLLELRGISAPGRQPVILSYQ
jgi:outer membrane protein TolC